MTILTDEPVQGDVTEAGTGNPPAVDDAASRETAKTFSDRMGDVLSGVYPSKADTPASDAASEDESASNPVAEPADASGTGEADKSGWTENEWGTYLAENFRRDSEIPRKYRAAAMETAQRIREEQIRSELSASHQQELAQKDDIARRAVELTQQRMERQFQLTPVFTTLAQGQDPESENYAPDAVINYRRQNPGGWAVFEAYERGGWAAVEQLLDSPQQQQAPPQQQASPATAAYQTAAMGQLGMLDDYKDARDRVEVAMRSIPATAEGLQQVTKLVKDELKQVLAGQANKADPAQKALEQRQEAAAQRQSIPRPDVATNGSGQGGDDINSLSYMEQMQRGFAQSMRTRR